MVLRSSPLLNTCWHRICLLSGFGDGESRKIKSMVSGVLLLMVLHLQSPLLNTGSANPPPKPGDAMTWYVPNIGIHHLAAQQRCCHRQHGLLQDWLIESSIGVLYDVPTTRSSCTAYPPRPFQGLDVCVSLGHPQQ